MCPLKAVTGWDCPLCGGLRGTHELLHGDVAGALNQNLLLPLYLGVVVLGLGTVLFGARTGRSWSWRMPTWGWVSVVAVLVVFTAVRNLPGVTFLPSGLG